MDYDAVWKQVMDVNLWSHRPRPLNKDSADKYKELLISDRLGEELNQAYEHVKSLPEMRPFGITAVCWGMTASCSGYRGGAVSGTLSQLVERKRVLSTIDQEKIGYIIESADHDVALKRLLGMIKVDITEIRQRDFHRVDKDAEVDASCLLMFWHSSNSEVRSSLIDLASELVFQSRDVVKF